jgi:cytochrome P450
MMRFTQKQPAVASELPPGPRWPTVVQTLAWWTRAIPLFEGCRARYGSRFTLRLIANVPMVNITDPDEVREVFRAPADVLHPGEGAGVLEPVVGRNSVILLDEDAHISQRKLLLPAFHGERMQALSGLMVEVAEREVATWPRNQATALHPRLQALTLEIVLRAVFGLEGGERIEILRDGLAAVLGSAGNISSALPEPMARVIAPAASRRFASLRESVDAELFALIDERRASRERGRDVLAMLLDAEHEDGSAMSPQELRDELMTLLVAGHETTASELAWAFERLVRAPEVLARVIDAVDNDDDAYLTATIQETLRRRPVLPNSAPRLVKKPIRVGPIDYPAGVALSPNAYLIHHDPALYPNPYTFRPERFLEEPPGTYTWIPFGGGRRRCIGASFAQLEMKIVLRAVLGRCEVRAGGPAGPEIAQRRSITLSPRRGSQTVLVDRASSRATAACAAQPAAA